MAIQRAFLGWKQAALLAATDYIVERYSRDRECDLSNVIVVVPGSRAGRRLLELLVQRADDRQLLFMPPRIVTEGELPELLYEPQRPLAAVLVQQLAWMNVLQQTPPAQLRPLVPHPPGADDPIRWLELAEMFRRQHAEFAADGLDFSAVLQRSKEWDNFSEEARWQTLRKLQLAYLLKLDELHLWDAQTARLVAIQKKEPRTDCDVILLGMVDMNKALRQMLDLVSTRVTALIVAPTAEAERFDSHGCLIPEAWQQLPLPLAESQMVRVEGPAEQADSVVNWVRDLNGRYAADEVVVGVADEALVPQLQRELQQYGLTARWVEGKKVAESAPYRLLDATTAYAERRRFADLASCVRHPDIYDWLQARLASKLKTTKRAGRDVPTILDCHYAERLSAWLDGEDLSAAVQRNEQDEIAQAMQLLVSELESLFVAWPTTRQPVGVWMRHTSKLLETIYGERFVERYELADRYLLECCHKVQDSLTALADLPAHLQPLMSLTDAIALALRPLERVAISPPPDSSAIELLGWLELPLDDAPALIVTTVNEGFVPESRKNDAFLPDALRRELGLLHDDRRYARDAYSLQVLAHSRPDFKLITARFDTKRDPLAPSRLLFTGPAEQIAQRALRWFSPPPPALPRPNLLAPAGKIPLHSTLEVPRPDASSWELDEITVTQFRSYLACPYRFYLSHVLRLQSHSDQAAELDAPSFGNLIHDVLQDFGRQEEINRSTDSHKLRNYFNERLDAIAAVRCRPRHARAAVRVQIEQARLRLRAFADWQAARTEAGWQIVFSETIDLNEKWRVKWQVDDLPITLAGRIDRIDYHPGQRTLSVLDYKTSDTAKGPDQVHRRAGEWVDLQLPLYRHLYKSIGLDANFDIRSEGVQLGYVNLPKDPASVGDRIAEWSPGELADADEQARHVIRALREKTFWPPNEVAPTFEDAYSAICQDYSLSRLFGSREVAP
ncbi:ATP-dependent helicase/deoxyribonuclease subunit B [Anatilimnocola aggregata]|uniref:ATP-dependent helicase/deoxyribonuclease subunit B n=1 Tax=Anatilimnocola aggregata TaxID=2528021 RepID=A0A517YIE8_9BACT|nr:PD-(D/E)XK nuclease family protein [Anatilimnocola aggregata]QDU29984.1 ATP-dependent helicase/deoxyribonuclease subunit B [Anatilimnocola aggregata]